MKRNKNYDSDTTSSSVDMEVADKKQDPEERREIRQKYRQVMQDMQGMS